MCGVSTKNKPLLLVYSRNLLNLLEKNESVFKKKMATVHYYEYNCFMCRVYLFRNCDITLSNLVEGRNLITVKKSDCPNVQLRSHCNAQCENCECSVGDVPCVVQCKNCASPLGDAVWLQDVKYYRFVRHNLDRKKFRIAVYREVDKDGKIITGKHHVELVENSYERLPFVWPTKYLKVCMKY